MNSDPTVLQSLGTFRIWTNLIFGPLFMLLLVAGMFFAWSYQRNWAKVTARVQTDQQCHFDQNTTGGKFYICPDTPLDVPGIGGTTRLAVASDTATLASGAEVPVTYDPADPQKTVTTFVFASRGAALGVLAIFLLIAIAWFVFNLRMRNDAGWQNVSGVMQGADIASGIASSFAR